MIRIKCKREYICYLLMVLSGMTYYSNLGYVFLTLAGMGFLMTHRQRLSVDGFSLLIIVYSVLYVAYGYYVGVLGFGLIVKNAVYPLAAFLIIVNSVNLNFEHTKNSIVAISLGYTALHFGVTLSYNRHNYYNVVVPWIKQELNPVNVNIYGVVATSFFFYATVFEKRRFTKIVCIILSLVSLYISVRLSKYTTIFDFFIVLAFNYILFLRKKRRRFSWLLPATIGAIFVFVFYASNLDIARRSRVFSASDSMNSRFIMWSAYFPSIFDHPFDGYNIRNPFFEWAHNFFIDVYIENGIIVMMILITIYIIHFIETFRLYLIIEDKSMFCFWESLSISLFLAFFINPIYVSNPGMMALAFIVMGVIHRMLLREDGKSVSEKEMNS